MLWKNKDWSAMYILKFVFAQLAIGHPLEIVARINLIIIDLPHYS